MKKLDCCRSCYGKVELAASLRPMPLTDDYDNQFGYFPTELFVCRYCGLVQLGIVIEPDMVFNSNYAYKTGSSPGLVRHFKEFSNDLTIRANLDKNSFVIDIGCNDGTLLKALNNKSGCKFLGIDPAASEMMYAIKEPFSIKVANNILTTYGQANLITATNVLAHVDDINGFLNSIKSLLKPNGLFAFEVGSLEAILNGAWETIYHEHLSYLSFETLFLVLGRVGFRIDELKEISTHGGSWQAICTVGEKLNLNSIPNLSNIPADINDRRNSIMELCDVGNVVAFGASAKASVLLWQTGLRPRIVIDDNIQKQGRYMPGTDIPILSRSILSNLNSSDKILILAWNEAEAIIKSLSEFEGRIVVAAPVPYVS